MPIIPQKYVDRLLDRLDKVSSPDGCWLWTGPSQGRGSPYGCMYTNVDGVQSQMKTHRMAYEIWVGPIPDGMIVCHRCDVTLCCNPDHLFLGTYSDNTQDCVAKGRKNPPRGERQGQSILTTDDVRAIRELRAQGHGATELARKFGVSQPTISMICARKRWSHIE